MAEIKLIASDLDGTLLDSSGKIPERNRDAVFAARERGVRFTISTGRMFHSARRFAAQLGIEIPMICYNGAMLCSPEGEVFSHDTLDLAIARELLAIFRDRGMYVQSYIEDVLYIRNPNDVEFQNYMRHFGITGKAVGDALYAPETAPTKLLVTTSGAEQSAALSRELAERFGARIYVTSSNADFVEVMNPDVNKGRALRNLADRLGIAMESVMAIGDGENDLEMIRAAGTGVAMANGRQRTKDAADLVAPANDEDGLAWAIATCILGERASRG